MTKDVTPMVEMMEIPTIKLNYAHSNILQANILELPYKGIYFSNLLQWNPTLGHVRKNEAQVWPKSQKIKVKIGILTFFLAHGLP